MTDLFQLSKDIPSTFKRLYEDFAMELEEDVLDPDAYIIGLEYTQEEEIKKYNDLLLTMLSEMESASDSITAMTNRLTDRKRRIQSRIEMIRNIIRSLLNITGRDKIQSDFGTSFKMKATKDIVFKDITEEEFFDKYPEYTKVERKLMKKQLLTDINDGVVVEGIELNDRDSIGVRR